MGYVIVGAICLVVGACGAFVIMALVAINSNTEREEYSPEEEMDESW